MSITNQQILKGTTTTTDLSAGGILLPEQSKKFIVQTMENTALGGLVRHETRQAKTGELDKIGIGRRLMRKKTENADDGSRAKPKHDKVEYSCVAVRLPWEITEETLRENIEGENYEKLVTDLMAAQVGIDMEDLWLNADVNTPNTDPDFDFLKLNDGWLKLIAQGGHVVDRSAKNGGALTLGVWNDALLAMPNKYNNGKLRWLMSPKRMQTWETYLLDKAITSGGIVSDRRIENPYAIPAVPVPSFPDDKVILTDPQNLIVVNTYDVKIRKTVEGKEAIMQDKRFYVIHLDFDTVVEELDAAVILTGLAAIQPSEGGN